MDNREKETTKASWIAIIGNGLLSISKIVIGLISGSLAVVSDGIDSATDIVTSLITLFTARIIAKPPDMGYPYGYERADTIATKTLSFVIFFAGAQLCISTIKNIIGNQQQELPATLALYITGISIVGKFLLSRCLARAGKKIQSAMLAANAKNMQNDVIISGTVLIGLFFTFTLHMPILDSLTALAVSFWIMKSAFDIFMQTNRELMDGVKNPEIYNKIFAAIDSVQGVTNPHKVRVRQLGNMYMVDIDIEVNGTLTVFESHEIAQEVEERIKQDIGNIYDIMVHIEPRGDDSANEKFGVNGKMLNDKKQEEEKENHS
ncbi:MAG TPA: cation diffusion facilitator family transporter [Candidatus Kapabacteria bacterium]|nr:cation diffusion facilitator family transporter [Candidatus Kapabacteria bacterium]